MNNNKLIISAAGSGKTTFLVNKALEQSKTEQVLITTYTEANEAEIRNKILEIKKFIPSNITIQTWFSFLLQHGVRPYQGSMNDILWENDIRGMLLSEGKSAGKKNSNGNQLIINGHPLYWGEDDFIKHYFSTNWRIYSDKISKFIFKCNKETTGEVISRLSRIFSHIYIDEVQDLAGYDLELIKLLFKSTTNILLVGDPRQITYRTHHTSKNKRKYGNGKIKEYLQDKCKSLLSDDSIDETTLKKSHRNNKLICDISSELYPEFEKSEPCECCNHSEEYQGVFLVKPCDVDKYLRQFKPIQLRWDKRQEVNKIYPAINFGESKGQTHKRVLIYPTSNMKEWVINRRLTNEIKKSRAKFYVALTRAQYSAAIVLDYQDTDEIAGIEKWSSDR